MLHTKSKKYCDEQQKHVANLKVKITNPLELWRKLALSSDSPVLSDAGTNNVLSKTVKGCSIDSITRVAV